MPTITLINPFSGAAVERQAEDYDQWALDLFASRMGAEEASACEALADGTDAGWLVNMVEVLGPKRAGEIILS